MNSLADSNREHRPAHRLRPLTPRCRLARVVTRQKRQRGALNLGKYVSQPLMRQVSKDRPQPSLGFRHQSVGAPHVPAGNQHLQQRSASNVTACLR